MKECVECGTTDDRRFYHGNAKRCRLCQRILKKQFKKVVDLKAADLKIINQQAHERFIKKYGELL